jgi:hypothetical protein
MRSQLVRRTRPSIRPSEAERIYHTYGGFVDGRKMTEDEFTEDMATSLRGVVRAHLRYTGKPRFLNKRTANTQRIELIAKIFPDAYYVHLIRDGRAVAASYYTVRWWRDIDIWWLGGNAATWEEDGRDPVELCGLQWQRNVKELLDHRHLFGDRYLELRYEELVQDPRDCIDRIGQFCELERSTEYLELIPETLPNMNHKWHERFDEGQKEILQRTIGDFLGQLGYSE